MTKFKHTESWYELRSGNALIGVFIDIEKAQRAMLDMVAPGVMPEIRRVYRD